MWIAKRIFLLLLIPQQLGQIESQAGSSESEDQVLEVEASGPAVFSVTAMLWIAREVSVGVRLKVNTA